MPAVLSSQKKLLKNALQCIRFLYAFSLWFEADLPVKQGTPVWDLNSIVHHDR